MAVDHTLEELMGQLGEYKKSLKFILTQLIQIIIEQTTHKISISFGNIHKFPIFESD